MKTFILSLALLLASALGQAQDLTQLTHVSWTDPAAMTEAKAYNPRNETPDDWLLPLARHLERKIESQLPPGNQMNVEIVDVLRAGRFEPWHGPGFDEVRIYRDNTPPRIELRFRYTDAHGNVISEGQQRLVDAGYPLRSSSSTDPLRYEKMLLDRWLRKTLSEGKR